MAGIREAKRSELRSKLMQSATLIMERDGVRGLNARNVTTDAGCALGSLYTVFEDLDDLIVHVNSQTLQKLGEFLQKRVEGQEEPVARLKTLAAGYIEFARNNFRLWNALFEYGEMASNVPDWHQKDQAILIRYIQGPVEALSPSLTSEQAEMRARTLFAAVHGVVAFSLQDRFIGLDRGELHNELMRFIDQMLAGL